ncbi:MAG TPA: glycosyltransferase family 4 protein [Anaerolineae bacterium]|nr:glycosyltransferase family 4 protein [Anaerolineae bacterium]
MTEQSILIVSAEFPPTIGGVGAYAYEVARAFHERGRAVQVLAARAMPGTRMFDVQQPFPIQRMPEPGWMLLRQAARLFEVRKAIAQADVTAVLATEWRVGLWASLFARRCVKPFLVTAHGSEILLALNQWWRAPLARWVYGRAKRVMADSRYARDLVLALGVPAERVQVVLLGARMLNHSLDQAHRHAFRERWGLAGRRVLLTVARLVPRKGHDVVLRALPEIIKVCPEAVYVIVGDGDQRSKLESLTRELGIADHVRFAGHLSDDVRDAFIDVCDVYLQPSRQDRNTVEGFGLSLVEAMARGKPVVATVHGGILDILRDGDNGLLIGVDDVAGLAHAVVDVLVSPDRAATLAVHARDTVERTLNWSRVIDDIESILALDACVP